MPTKTKKQAVEAQTFEADSSLFEGISIPDDIIASTIEIAKQLAGSAPLSATDKRLLIDLASTLKRTRDVETLQDIALQDGDTGAWARLAVLADKCVVQRRLIMKDLSAVRSSKTTDSADKVDRVLEKKTSSSGKGWTGVL